MIRLYRFSTTPNKLIVESTFKVKCGDFTDIGSDLYNLAPDGFTEDDEKKKPYICKNGANTRGTWGLLFFCHDGECSSIEGEHGFDKSLCAQEA